MTREEKSQADEKNRHTLEQINRKEQRQKCTDKGLLVTVNHGKNQDQTKENRR